ncbi:hypothetical protein [Streptomyces sp. AGS-58]|uniref:hypothetical protein n=1 Tax=unclassified Streptomyces TaxID=2593676 RepID=UPI0035A32940
MQNPTAPEGMVATCVRLDGLATYPAFVAAHDRHETRVTPYFDFATVCQLADDTQAAAAHRAPRSGETIHVLEAAPGTNGEHVVVHVDWATASDDRPAELVKLVAPSEHGLYPVGQDAWHWTLARWMCSCDTDNAWQAPTCRGCGTPREKAIALVEAGHQVGDILRRLAPEATSALADIAGDARIIAVFAAGKKLNLGDGGPFDTETLGEADAVLKAVLSGTPGLHRLRFPTH